MAWGRKRPEVERLAGGQEFVEGQAGTALGLGHIFFIGTDSLGRLLVSVRELDRVFARRADGTLEVFAGVGTWSYGPGGRIIFGGDGGPAREAFLYGPAGVAGGAQGEVYICDYRNARIRRVDRNGIIQTVVGTGQAGVLPLKDFPAGGLPGLSVPLSWRCEMVVDERGHLWFSEGRAQRVYEFDPATGLVRVALCRERKEVGEPTGLAAVGERLFVADGGFRRVLVLDLKTGKVSVWLSTRSGQPKVALRYVTGLAWDGGQYLYIADERANQVLRSDLRDRSVSPFAGTGEAGYSGDGGPALQARFHWPRSLAVGRDGTVYVTDTMNFRVRAIGPEGLVQTVVGRDLGDGGPAKEACLLWPQGVAVDGEGNVYVSDSEHCRVRRIDAGSGEIETVAGGGTFDPRQWEGDPSKVYVGYPLGLALAGSGTLYIADEKGPCVWKLDLVGKRISCAARDRRLRAPVDVAVGEAGELYIADGASHVVWRVDGRGQLSVFAGRPGEGGFSGDGGPASAAQLSRPRAVCCGPEGQLYISDSGNLRIREVRDGKIETWAGTGGKGNPKEGEDVTRTGLESLTTLKVDEKGRVITCKARGACRIEGTGRKAHWLMGSVPQEDHGVQFAHVAVGAGCLVVADQKHHAVHRVRVG